MVDLKGGGSGERWLRKARACCHVFESAFRKVSVTNSRFVLMRFMMCLFLMWFSKWIILPYMDNVGHEGHVCMSLLSRSECI
jgi:hypothetical protein